jgi:hypothetical protein
MYKKTALVVATLSFIFLVSCNGLFQFIDENNRAYLASLKKGYNEHLDSLVKKYCTQRIELRDSLYIVYTVKYWRNHGGGFYWWVNESRLFFINNEDIHPYISAVFYSPDRKKMIFWLGEKMPNAYSREVYNGKQYRMEPSCGDTIYEAAPMIGYRDSINQPWKISILPGRHTGGSTQQIVDNELARFCFINLKVIELHYVFQGGAHKAELTSKPYGKNLQDIGFWDSWWLNEKDTVGADNLYFFQEQVGGPYYHPDSDGVERYYKYYRDLHYPKIDYPKEILDMYKEK